MLDVAVLMFCNIDFTRTASQSFFPTVCFVGKGIILEVLNCGTVWIPNRIVNSDETV